MYTHALHTRRWPRTTGAAAALLYAKFHCSLGGVNRRQGGYGRGRSRLEVEECSKGRDTYFFFVVFFFFTVFFAFGAAAFAARFAFAMMITRIGLCEEMRRKGDPTRPPRRWVHVWLAGSKVAEICARRFRHLLTTQRSL